MNTKIPSNPAPVSTIIVPPNIPSEKFIFNPQTVSIPDWNTPVILTFEEPCEYYHISGVFTGRGMTVSLGSGIDLSRCFYLWKRGELLIPAVSQQLTLASDGSGTLIVTVTAISGYMIRYVAGTD